MENLFTSSPPQPKTTVWTFEENTMFENFIAEFNITSAVVFERIAFRFPGKTMDQIKQHYQALVEDVEKIALGLVPLPDYKDVNSNEISKSAIGVETKPGYQHRRKVVPWSKEEHEFVLICSPNGNFLTGLTMYGKGDWKSISRYSVRTRNPTQVASHAQKYYLRLNKNPNPRQNASSASQPNKPFNAPAVVASSFGSSVPGIHPPISISAPAQTLLYLKIDQEY